MEIKSIIVASQAELINMEWSIYGLANYFLVGKLPIHTEISVIIRVLAYPADYERDYVMKLIAIDEDGKL